MALRSIVWSETDRHSWPAPPETDLSNGQNKTTVVNPPFSQSSVLCRDNSILQVLTNLSQFDISSHGTGSCFIAILVKDERGSFEGAFCKSLTLVVLATQRNSHRPQAKVEAENQNILVG